MTSLHLNHSAANENINDLMATYRRLAAMDPPALRSLAGELRRMSDESFASAGLESSPVAHARADRDAQRFAAAEAALASLATDGEETVADGSDH